MNRNDKLRVLIAGQMPPPVGGQNLNVKRFFNYLNEIEDIEVIHWKMEFTKNIGSFRKFGIGKLIELAKVIARLFVIRSKGKIDIILYSTGGPHTVPIIRDIMLLPLSTLFSKKVWIHFQAAGIAGKIDNMNVVLRKLLMLTHSYCYGGIALTNYGKEDPLSLKMKKVVILNNGIEDTYDPRLENNNSDSVTILYVGHVCNDKGVPSLIRAFNKVSRDYKNLSLCIVGECLTPYTEKDLLQEIQNCHQSLDVKYLGLKKGAELSKEFANADLLVFPSIAPYESFGLVMIEGMMWGLPIIASDWRANKEVLGDEIGGVCYEIKDSHTLALEKSLRECLDQQDLWKNWGEKNRDPYEEY